MKFFMIFPVIYIFYIISYLTNKCYYKFYDNIIYAFVITDIFICSISLLLFLYCFYMIYKSKMNYELANKLKKNIEIKKNSKLFIFLCNIIQFLSIIGFFVIGWKYLSIIYLVCWLLSNFLFFLIKYILNEIIEKYNNIV